MSSIAIGLITYTSITFGMIFGLKLRQWLPDHHLKDDSKDVVKTASGLIATLVALVIGLLVGSAKNSFDSTSDGLTQTGAKIITLDRVLQRYGPGAKAAREQLRNSTRGALRKLWPGGYGSKADLESVERSTAAEDLDDQLRGLVPTTEAQKQLLVQALDLSRDIQQWRWVLIEKNQNTLPTMFLFVLVLWLTLLFVSFGLLSPRNPTTITTLMIAAASISCAIFLILEMSHPFDGTIQVTGAPLHKALMIISQ